MRGLGYYISNLIVILSYLGLRQHLPTVFNSKYSNVKYVEEVFAWEWHVALTWVAISGVKLFRSKSNEAILASVFFYSKTVVFALLFTGDWRLCTLYVLMCFVIFLLFPVPFYDNTDKLMFLTPGNFLESVAAPGTDKTWLVEFYASFSIDCANFSRTMSDVAEKYSSNRLKFGLVDVGSWPAVASSLNIEPQSQLPCLILFENGKEHSRLDRSMMGRIEISKGKAVSYFDLERRCNRG